MIKKLSLALFLGAALSAAPLLIERTVSFRPGLYAVSDGLWLPGALLARIFYPAGIHTGRGSDVYVPLAVTLNFLIYFGITLGILMLIQRVKSGGRRELG